MGAPVFMYHASEGARMFDSGSLPSEAEGWFDCPTKARLAMEAKAAQPKPPATESLEPPRFGAGGKAQKRTT